MKWISVNDELPTNSIKEPVFTKRNAPFKYGIAYKVPCESGSEWKLDPVVTHWLIPEEPQDD